MPKLIVYVRADTWRRIQEAADGDAAPLARAVSVQAIEEFVAGLSEAGDGDAAERVSPQAEQPVSASAAPPASESTRKRMHPCKHHVPPTRVCQYCDR